MRTAVALVGALLLACGPGSTAATPAPTLAAPTSQAPASTAASTAAASPAATAASARADVLLKFAPGVNIADVDDITDIVLHLRSTPGIHDGFGDEGQITVVYDPRLITVEKIRGLLEEMGFKTLPAGS